MNKSYDWIVIGGGYRSIVASYALAKTGKTVAIIEAGNQIGGFLSPIKWDKYWIDKGPQFFDNFETSDVEFFNEMIGPNILQEIGFSYSSYLNGKKTDGFAIPDWRSHGEEFTKKVFDELLALHIDQYTNGSNRNAFQSLDELISFDGAKTLKEPLNEFCNKFLRQSPEKLNASAGSMVSFFGRKLLFDQDISVDLKKSPIIDGLLAAQKVQVAETRYNLYPKGSSLETVRKAMEDALKRVGVDILLNTTADKIDFNTNAIQTIQGELTFGTIFMGCDIRDAEKTLTGGTTIAEDTHVLPEIFHCYVVPASSVDESYYMVDYDQNHLACRMTNFCNYMGCVDDEGNGVICVEQPIDKDSVEWQSPEKDQARIFEEAIEAGNIADVKYSMAKSFRIPSTYKVPKKGIETKVDAFLAQMKTEGGDKLLIPDGYTLTRKEAMDDLRNMKII